MLNAPSTTAACHFPLRIQRRMPNTAQHPKLRPNNLFASISRLYSCSPPAPPKRQFGKHLRDLHRTRPTFGGTATAIRTVSKQQQRPECSRRTRRAQYIWNSYSTRGCVDVLYDVKMGVYLGGTNVAFRWRALCRCPGRGPSIIPAFSVIDVWRLAREASI